MLLRWMLVRSKDSQAIHLVVAYPSPVYNFIRIVACFPSIPNLFNKIQSRRYLTKATSALHHVQTIADDKFVFVAGADAPCHDKRKEKASLQRAAVSDVLYSMKYMGHGFDALVICDVVAMDDLMES